MRILLPWNWSKKYTYAGVCLYLIWKTFEHAAAIILVTMGAMPAFLVFALACVVVVAVASLGMMYFKVQGKIDERKAGNGQTA